MFRGRTNLVTGDHMQKVFFIRAEWDNDASIWSATSDDVLGLATEADSIDILLNKLSSMVPELMLLNKLTDQPEIVYEVLARKSSIAYIPTEA
jgi:hypothetical protein